MEPLRIRFQRIARRNSTGYTVRPFYGKSLYITVCGRFKIGRSRGGAWVIVGGRPKSWGGWLASTGLERARFGTRKEALEMLTAVLEADGLRDAADPA